MRANKQLWGVLKINALYSMTSGLVSMLFATELSSRMGIPDTSIVRYIGMILMAFSISVFIVGFKRLYFWVKLIIVMDWLWVLGVLLLVSGFIYRLPPSGNWIVILISIPVLLFGWLQIRFANR